MSSVMYVIYNIAFVQKSEMRELVEWKQRQGK